MATSITKKPSKRVTGLGAPERGSNNRQMTATWKVPSAMTSSTSKSRATGLVLRWKLNISGKVKTLEKSLGTGITTSTIDLSDFAIGSESYTRSSFYPFTNDTLTSVTVEVSGKNKKGEGKPAIATRRFYQPRKPEIDPIAFNTSNGHCVTTIRTDSGDDYNERYDTHYRITVTDRDGNESVPSTGVTVTSGQTTYTEGERALTSTEFTVEYDVSGYQSLPRDKFIKVVIEAWARGYVGDSSVETREYYVSKPEPATITDINVSSKDSTGILTAFIDTNQTEQYPVDTVRLEYLANTTYENASDIPAQGVTWDDSGIEDNGDCTALSMPITNLVPDRGKFTWIRIKSFHANEAVLFTYSEYKRVIDLETPPAEQAESTIAIISAVSGADGESAIVLLGWNASGTDDSTGTELSWADEEDTWKSTKDPEKYEFTWTDGRYPATGTKQYNDSAEITIKGLTEGQKYYVRARRYYEGESVSYGRYSNQVTVIPSGKPSAVVASCKKYLAWGEPLQVYWTFASGSLQTEWAIKDSNGTYIAEGTGSLGSTQISWKRIEALAVSNSITFSVGVSTGSGFQWSATKTVQILQKPTLTVTASATLTAQPYSFTAASNRLCDLIVIVTAQGASGQFPEGFKTQTAGDTIHSDVYSPTWTNGATTITLPSGLDFWDLGSYTLSVTAVDRETGLRTDAIERDFKVAWTNKAVNPESAVSVMPLDYRTDEGDHIQAVRITLTAPTGSRASDVYDIYRMDGDNAHLIGEGFPLSVTVEDEYAPFGDNEDLYYRVALRTVDGDVEFTDKEYTLESDTVRFDWQGGSLELPYDVSIADSYSKSVEFRQHMDGSVDGYWNPNIERKGSYSSSVIKLIQPEEINLARQLARYAGAVFVRTANGSAFTADVQVTDLSVKNKAVTLVSFDATEVGLTEEFMLPTPFELGS